MAPFSKILIPIDFQNAAWGQPASPYSLQSAFTLRSLFYTLSLRLKAMRNGTLSAKNASRSIFVTFFAQLSHTWM